MKLQTIYYFIFSGLMFFSFPCNRSQYEMPGELEPASRIESFTFSNNSTPTKGKLLQTFHLMLLNISSYAQLSALDSLYRLVSFESQGAILRGRMYMPEESSAVDPVIIMAHGFTTTINGMTADKYAERFRKAGYKVVLYDHRNLGISDGEPRQEINFWIQARGYIDAIDFVCSHPDIDTDEIAVWGASMSSREAFLAGVMDNRVKAVIAMIPAFGEQIPEEDKDGSSYTFAKETLLTEDIKSLPHRTTEQMPIVSTDQNGTPSVLKELTAYRWFIEYGGRFGTNWQNIVSFSIVDSPDKFNLGQLAPHLKAPILMVVASNDEMHGANPEVTRHIFNTINQPKEWIDVDGGHFGLLYYPSPIFDKSSEAQIGFLKKQLK